MRERSKDEIHVDRKYMKHSTPHTYNSFRRLYLVNDRVDQPNIPILEGGGSVEEPSDHKYVCRARTYGLCEEYPPYSGVSYIS